MTTCDVQASGAIELYFYGELTPCRAGRRRTAPGGVQPTAARALDELATIRARSPRGRRCRLRPAATGRRSCRGSTRAIASETRTAVGHAAGVRPRAAVARRSYVGYLAMAALLALVTIERGDRRAVREARPSDGPRESTAARSRDPATPADRRGPAGERQAFAALSEEHFERSKLVVLGLATKDAERATSARLGVRAPARVDAADRHAALSAGGRGSRADVARRRHARLELVLLQTSLTDETDPASLAQIQRLIHKRDLVEKMDVVTTSDWRRK